jgi:hypothetical protein
MAAHKSHRAMEEQGILRDFTPKVSDRGAEVLRGLARVIERFKVIAAATIFFCEGR